VLKTNASGYLMTENLLDTRRHEFEGEEIRRLKNERAAINQMSFTAGTPLSVRLRMTAFFLGKGYQILF